MKEELEKQLFEKYPKIFRQKELSMNQTCMCWGISTGDGWYNILDALCGNIQGYIDSEIERNQYRKERGEAEKEIVQVEATQVKEKFGGLRFYINWQDDYIDGLIRMAESMSYRTCEECGVPGKPNEGGWIITLCEPCREKRKKS
jgi:hypothetical protein